MADLFGYSEEISSAPAIKFQINGRRRQQQPPTRQQVQEDTPPWRRNFQSSTRQRFSVGTEQETRPRRMHLLRILLQPTFDGALGHHNHHDFRSNQTTDGHNVVATFHWQLFIIRIT
jgi:hypothetical protein